MPLDTPAKVFAGSDAERPPAAMTRLPPATAREAPETVPSLAIVQHAMLDRLAGQPALHRLPAGSTLSERDEI